MLDRRVRPDPRTVGQQQVAVEALRGPARGRVQLTGPKDLLVSIDPHAAVQPIDGEPAFGGEQEQVVSAGHALHRRRFRAHRGQPARNPDHVVDREIAARQDHWRDHLRHLARKRNGRHEEERHQSDGRSRSSVTSEQCSMR